MNKYLLSTQCVWGTKFDAVPIWGNKPDQNPACVFLICLVITNILFFIPAGLFSRGEDHAFHKTQYLLLFSTIWVELEGIMLSEINQTKTLYDITYM